MKEGNAVPIYLRLVHEQNDATRKYWTETPKPWNAMSVPYPQARPFFEAANKRLLEAPHTEGHVLARSLISDLNKVMSPQTALERSLAALRVIEALRMHAAVHDGKLPDKLDDVTEVPIPNDPGTDRPFEYSRDGDTATLVSLVPGDPIHNNGLRYRVTIGIGNSRKTDNLGGAHRMLMTGA